MDIIPIDKILDKPFRRVSEENLKKFQGLVCQLLVIKESHRPIVMDGETVGGVFHCVSLDELEEAKQDIQIEIDKKQPTGNYITVEEAEEKFVDKTQTAAEAVKAEQDEFGNNIFITYATKAELTAGLDTKSDLGHTHETEDITDLAQVLANKAALLHTHTTTQITDFTEKLNEGLATKADVKHTHTTDEITNLDDSLASKANVEHTHQVSQIEGLSDLAISGSFEDLTDVPASFMGWGAPNYAGAIQFSENTYTAPSNGYLVIDGMRGIGVEGGIGIQIDGFMAAKHKTLNSGDSANVDFIQKCPIAKGQTATLTGIIDARYFIPLQ